MVVSVTLYYILIVKALLNVNYLEMIEIDLSCLADVNWLWYIRFFDTGPVRVELYFFKVDWVWLLTGAPSLQDVEQQAHVY